jgi:predicted AAA+ superfamily ATPase
MGILDALSRVNTWWESSTIRRPLLKELRRDEFNTILESLESRHILSIIGPRRVGKSTLIFQLIDYLLAQKVNPLNILFFTGDNPALFTEGATVSNVIDIYINEVLHGLPEFPAPPELEDKRVYIFIDEIHFIHDWQLHLKNLYDQNYNVKFIVSGSSSVHLFKESKESLLGRIDDIHVLPLDLNQFLRFYDALKGKGKTAAALGELPQATVFDDPARYFKSLEKSRIQLFNAEPKINKALGEYLLAGGYPEYFETTDLYRWQQNLLDAVVARGLYRDVVSMYGVKSPEILEKLLYLAASESGGEFSYSFIGQTLGIDKLTAQTYLRYLSEAFLVMICDNYSSKTAAVIRKNKKIHIGDSGVRNAYLNAMELSSEEQGFLVENACVRLARSYCEKNFARLYYWRDKNKEVDIVIKKRNGLIPVEVKYRNTIRDADLAGISAFMEKNKCSAGLVITKKLLEKRGKLYLIPLWMVK